MAMTAQHNNNNPVLPTDPIAPIAVVCLTQRALPTARKIASSLQGATVHGLRTRVSTRDVDLAFDDTIAHLQQTFSTGHVIIGVCASGILIRALAPLLSGKWQDAAVIAVDESGDTFIPLLGGHHGGNRLARDLADRLGGFAAITTPGDAMLGLALDEPPAGWKLGTPDTVKPATAALLAGASARLEIEAGSAAWLTNSAIAQSDDGSVVITATARATDESDTSDAGPETAITYHPPVLALGVGCERGCPVDDLYDLVMETLAGQCLSPKAIACVSSIDLKADEAAVHELANRLGVPARFFDATTLEAEADRLVSPSDVVFAETGCHGVAEGAALATVGATGKLIVPKHKTKKSTCAVALSQDDIIPENIGTAQGRLSIVGIGPGQIGWRSPEATALIGRATDIVGYQMYLDLLGPLIDGKHCHHSDLGAEEARARHALELAATGKDVALIGSGDAGIYALATLVFELLDREDRTDWNRVAVQVSPGISALQAAAARIGAPLGHDFCAISLSDLLTPREDILRRLKSAAEGDFVIAFYNPVSKRRRDLLAKARDILLEHRNDDTPVVLGRQLGRPDEEITVVPLSKLEVDMVDMLTTVLVGSSNSRHITRGENEWVYTPRGYAKKGPDAAKAPVHSSTDTSKNDTSKKGGAE
ncbi:precorrin-3B methylase [Thalassospira sp. MCCC 1A01148]|uniref:Precorrin-3B methylase n=2 Tax=Thalassospiraceae TaxID=2844866 RepID=A0A367VFQ4_9PROT|nr:precorrin-3B C(17)-methyltransferase [Thalassospira sp. MCCC 1A01148]KZB71611.1 precorrin-3B methylase [Thalassospira sp. MCCC 1A01148]MBR9898637.1 precorrin-3B C(17)-methyltransferase [Rhodospirillales bacterium]RCK24058.1 precorrin-3B methylase [Thalassospira profundimaris]